ncbi:MAG TPA: glycosyl hydrolase family 65 protein [Solirubrobacteraceae bacterium]
MRQHAEWPVDPWALVEEGIDLDQLGQTESLFALGNGHVGLRGNLDEGEPRHLSGSYLNGFYESYPLSYGESGYGFAEDGQLVVNVTDGKIMRLQVEDEPLDIHRGEVEDHTRRLDFRSGVLERSVRWRSAGGHRVEVDTRRLVSLALRSIAAVAYEVRVLDRPMRIALQSNLQANQRQASQTKDPRKGHALQEDLESCLHRAHELRVVLVHRTRRSGLTVAAGMEHVVECDGDVATLTQVEPDLGRVTLSTELQPGQTLRVVKLLSYHWSGVQTVEFLRDQADASLESAADEGFDGLAETQSETLEAFWDRFDVQVDGDDELQQALRFAMFHLGQASLRAEGRALAAKALTGTGYNGHAFWDTEAFVLPILNYTVPHTVRDALEWRHSTLPAARERARQLGLRGAALPWRTIHGEECSGYWPAGTAAFHINAAVARAVRRYVATTGDEEFERRAGLELLVESARLWMSLGFHDADEAFHINGVTGPDEYSALVDDNVYTNLMAQENLWSAVASATRHEDVAAELDVTEEERAAWKRAADEMHVPYDDELGVHPQDAGFLLKQTWDFENTPPDHYPLMLHYPYVLLYARQVVKQADLVLAMQFRGDAFTPEQKRANFDFYEALTVRDSSLSAATQAVIAAEVGHLDLAYAYTREAALMDLHDIGRNTADGLHMASLAGALLATVSGFGGARDHGGELSFRPRLPRQLNGFRCAFAARGALVRVEVSEDEATYTLDEGDEFKLCHEDEELTLSAGERVSRPLARHPGDFTPPKQPPGREPGVERKRSASDSREGKKAKAGAGARDQSKVK